MLYELNGDAAETVAGGKGMGVDPNGGDNADHGSYIDPNG